LQSRGGFSRSLVELGSGPWGPEPLCGPFPQQYLPAVPTLLGHRHLQHHPPKPPCWGLWTGCPGAGPSGASPVEAEPGWAAPRSTEPRSGGESCSRSWGASTGGPPGACGYQRLGRVARVTSPGNAAFCCPLVRSIAGLLLGSPRHRHLPLGPPRQGHSLGGPRGRARPCRMELLSLGGCSVSRCGASHQRKTN